MRKRNLALVLLSIAAVMSISACEGKKTKENEPKAVETPIIAEEPKTLQEAVEQLEKEGKYPVLDRTETIEGKDENKNGIRDDIETYIDSLPITKEQKGALKQEAYVYNLILQPEFDVNNANQRAEMDKLSWNAIDCGMRKFMKNNSDEAGYDLYDTYSNNIMAFTYNTKRRMEKMLEYEKKISGTSSRMPEGDGCDEKYFK